MRFNYPLKKVKFWDLGKKLIFNVLDNNGNNQDAFIMICSKSNTSNHYGGSGSSPKCNNSSSADNRYVLQMDRSLNVNLFRYNSKTSKWVKTKR